MIISVHIPKTGGSSLRTALRQSFGDRLLLDYGDKPTSNSISHRLRRLRRRTKVRFRANELAASYDAVHGYFIASKYLPLGDRAAYTAFFRDPVERLLSHYRYFEQTPRPGNTMWDEMHLRRMTPGELAALPTMRGFYRLFTGGLPMERFAFIGLTEEYRTSLTLFRAVFGIDIQYHHVNASERAESDIESRELHEVKAAQRDNFLIYDAARYRFDALCRQHL